MLHACMVHGRVRGAHATQLKGPRGSVLCTISVCAESQTWAGSVLKKYLHSFDGDAGASGSSGAATRAQ